MDIWHFSLLYNLFVIHIMLPFCRSDLNIVSLSPALLRNTQAHVTEAYLISAFGYAGILVGGELWRIRLKIGLRATFARWMELPAQASLLLLNSKPLLILHGIVAVAIIMGVLAYYFKVDGFGFNLRGLLLVMPALRPIAQFTAFYSVLVGSYALVRFVVYREKVMLLVTALITIGLLFFGERANLAAIVMLLVIGTFIRMGRKLRIIWIFAGVTIALFFVFLLDGLRNPNFSLAAVFGGIAISMFYGNSFSDTRDFALILSFWDGHYFLGKTYLAGLIAFVPRFLSSFRDTWAIGVVTATMAGFSPKEHPGLRVGIFGEAYLNFGLLGVLPLSLAIGSVVRLIDMRMKQSVALLPRKNIRVFSYYLMTLPIGVAENSSLASSFYSIMLILGLSWVAQRVAKAIKITC